MTNQAQGQTAAIVIEESLRRYQKDREAASMGRTLRDVMILVGHELWHELRARPELNQPGEPWRITPDLGLECWGMPVFRVDASLVAGLRGWRFVLETPVSGQAGS